jgi:hypothetical protein
MSFSSESERDKRRAFTRTQKNQIWYQQDGFCAICKNKLDTRTVEYDHKEAWAAQGRTITTNGRALCANCHKIETHEARLLKIEKEPNVAHKTVKTSRQRKSEISLQSPKNTNSFLVDYYFDEALLAIKLENWENAISLMRSGTECLVKTLSTNHNATNVKKFMDKNASGLAYIRKIYDDAIEKKGTLSAHSVVKALNAFSKIIHYAEDLGMKEQQTISIN